MGGGSAVPVAWDYRMQMKSLVEPIAKAEWVGLSGLGSNLFFRL